MDVKDAPGLQDQRYVRFRAGCRVVHTAETLLQAIAQHVVLLARHQISFAQPYISVSTQQNMQTERAGVLMSSPQRLAMPAVTHMRPGVWRRRWQDLSPSAKDLLMGMMAYNTKHRLTAAQVRRD